MKTTIGWIAALMMMTAGHAHAEVAATGTFGIDVSVPFPFTSGTFDGSITGFDPGPFSVDGTPVDLQSDVGTMSLVNGNIPVINGSALTATFNFDAVDTVSSPNPLSFAGAGIAICTDAVTCSQGQGTFVADVSNIFDQNGVLPAGFVYTFDGTVVVDPGPFDAAGVFGLNAFPPLAVQTGVAAMISSNPTTFFDSRRNTLRDFLVDLTFAEVTMPGTVSFLGKSAMPGTLPTNISVNPDVSVFIDIVTGDGLAYDPPVDVCVSYDDVDQDGFVDGTTVRVIELKVLHAAALGQNFQDVTTTTDGGKVCGQVGSLSPFLVAVGPPPTTTSTSTTLLTTTTTTTVTTTTSTSSTTLPTGNCADALECLDAALAASLCGTEVLPPKLQKPADKKLGKAATLIEKAGAATKLAKAVKFVGKARKQVEKVGIKAEKFRTHKKTPISPECADTIGAVVDVILTAIDEGRLGVTLPTE